VVAAVVVVAVVAAVLGIVVAAVPVGTEWLATRSIPVNATC
jgi:hypothetical protein